MKRDLFILRHATAEDGGSSAVMRDYDRELVSKGIMESAKVGNYLKSYFPNIESIISSGALRALDTAKYVAEQIGFDVEKIEVSDALYGNGPRGYLEVLNKIDKNVKSVILVGHNPDISYFTEYLSHDDIGGSLRKASTIHLQFEDLEWNEISKKSGDFVHRIDGKSL